MPPSKVMDLVHERLSPRAKAKVLNKVFADPTVLRPTFEEDPEVSGDVAVLKQISIIYEDPHLRRLVVEKVVRAWDEGTAYVGSRDIVAAMVEVTVMKHESDVANVQLPDFSQDENNARGSAALSAAREEHSLPLSTRMLFVNEKVDEYITSLDDKVQRYVRMLRQRPCDTAESPVAPNPCKRRRIAESPDESEKDAALSLIRSLWDGWILDKGDIGFKKDGLGLPFLFTEAPRARGTAYQGTYRPHGAESSGSIDVAVRVLDYPAELTHLRTKVLREGLILDSMRHSNLVKFHGACLPQGGPETAAGMAPQPSSSGNERKTWIVTELMSGTLGDAVTEGYVKSRRAKLLILHSVAAALDHLHTKRVAHQAINEGNVLVNVSDDTATGRRGVTEAKLSEFGVSRFVRDVVSRSRSVHGNDRTKAPAELAFRAPEMLRHDDESALPADVWGFAALCTYLFVGKTAAWEMSWVALMQGAVGGELSRESQRFAEKVEFFELSRLCVKCFNHDPAERPTMREVYLVLREFTKAEYGAARIPIRASISDELRPLWKRVVVHVESPSASLAGRSWFSPCLVVYRNDGRKAEAVYFPRAEPSLVAGNDVDFVWKGKDREEFAFNYPCDESNVGENEDREEYVVELWADGDSRSNMVCSTVITLKSLVEAEERKAEAARRTIQRKLSETVERRGLDWLTFDEKVVPGICISAEVSLHLRKAAATGVETVNPVQSY